MSLAVYPAAPGRSLRRVADDPLLFLRELASGHGDVVPFRLGRQRAFLINSPALIEQVLVKHPDVFVKGRGFDRAKRLLGNGLLTASGEHHAQRRRVSHGAFQARHLSSYARIIVDSAVRVGVRWREGAPVDVGDEMRQLTLSVAGEAFFGLDLSGWTDTVASAVAIATPDVDGLISLVRPLRDARRARHLLEPVVDDILARGRQSEGPAGSLLTSLQEATDLGDPASVSQLRDDIVTFLLAGHDTLAHGLTWTWTLLGQHPDVDARLAQEVKEVLGSRVPSFEDLPRLTYARGVLAESLRLFPPAWVIVRRAACAHTCGATDIPAGAVIVVSPFVTQRDARFFPKSLSFVPDRWVSSQESGCPRAADTRPKFAYFPFGGGVRACIGESFAWLEGTLALATLAQNWRLTGGPGPIAPSPRITLRPAGPVPMVPHARA